MPNTAPVNGNGPRPSAADVLTLVGADDAIREHHKQTDGPQDGPDSVRVSRWTAADLMSATFPEPRWAVPGLLAEGVSLLAGPPKVGKSWLSLGLAVAVASGGKALGRIDVTAGPVLYLALEDTGRRLKSRLSKVLGTSLPPAGLTFDIECPPLPTGGIAQIAEWLEANPSARLIIIDVFAKLRGAPPPGLSAYDADYLAVGHIKRLADHYGVAVVLVHHTRKHTSDDFLADVSGTNGLAGAADATIVLRRARGKASGVLHVTGRDIDEAEYAMDFDADRGRWQMNDGPADEADLSRTRTEILRYLHRMPGAGPKQIADDLGIDHDLVRATIRRMAKDGQIDSDGRGRYLAPSSTIPELDIPA